MRMIRWFWKSLAFGSLVVTVYLSAACFKTGRQVHETLKPPMTLTADYRQGCTEANIDLAAGRLRYRTYGLARERGGPNLYAEHLRNDYNVELVVVAGCVVTEELVNRTRGYNDAALPVIEALYGKGILQRVHKQAADQWKQSHPSK